MRLPKIPPEPTKIAESTGAISHEWLRWARAVNEFLRGLDNQIEAEKFSSIYVDDNVIFGGQSGDGIKVNHLAPSYPWRDLIGEVFVKGTGATDPNWATYQGTISAYQFQLNDVCWCNFHMLHDYVPNTDLFAHVHWSHNSAAVVAGSVTWEFEISWAKGYDRAAFSAPKTISVSQAASTSQYRHMIAEVQITNAGGDSTHIDRALIETDGLLLVRTKLSANSMSAGTEPFVHYVDVHYQTTGMGTQNRNYPFYP